MTLQDVKNIVGLFTSIPMPVEIFETLYNDATLKLFLQRYGEKDFEALRQFRKVLGDGSSPLYVVSGIAAIPKDYFAFESAYHKVFGELLRINFVDDQMFDNLLTDKIEYPTFEYAIGNVQSNYIRIRPVQVKFVVFSYFIKPTNITYAVNDTLGFLEFDEANSSPCKWDEINIVALVQIILQSIGITQTQSEIQQKQQKQ